MAWTATRTWATGEIPTATQANAYWKDNLDFLYNAHGVRAYRANAQSTTSGTLADISFGNESFDTDGYHDNTTNPTRLTVPAGLAGLYMITGQITWTAVASSDNRILRLRKNGATDVSEAIQKSINTAGLNDSMQIVGQLQLVAGDYIELRVRQSSGAALDTVGGEYATWLAMYRVGA